MRPRRRSPRVWAPIAVLTVAAVVPACTGSPQEQTATTVAPRIEEVKEAFVFSNASADVATAEGSFTTSTLDRAESSGYDPSDEGSLRLAEPDGKGILITWKAGTEPDVDDAFVRVDLGSTPEMQFPDGWHTQCTVKIPTRTPDTVAGSFDCKDLPSFSDPDRTLATASGTFTAQR